MEAGLLPTSMQGYGSFHESGWKQMDVLVGVDDAHEWSYCTFMATSMDVNGSKLTSKFVEACMEVYVLS